VIKSNRLSPDMSFLIGYIYDMYLKQKHVNCILSGLQEIQKRERGLQMLLTAQRIFCPQWNLANTSTEL
jgi:hypothetical protein